MTSESPPPDDPATDPLDALFARDPGPASHELAHARLLLKRALAHESRRSAAPRPPIALRRLPPTVLLVAQAAGFALLIALLAPLLPKMLPASSEARPGNAVATLVAEVSEVGAWLEPLLPRLPVFTLPSPDEANDLLPAAPKRLLHWIPSLHSDAR